MNPTETPNDDMDFRTFFGKCPTAAKTETKPETKTEEKPTAREVEAWEGGYEDGWNEATKEVIHDLLEDGWKFEPTLQDLANNCPPMSKVIGDEMIYRYITEAEGKRIYFPGREIHFPVRWGWGEVTYETRVISQKDWDKGDRWTFEWVWRIAKAIYSKNKQRAVKEMGDHQFWEGIGTDGKVWVGS
jgi:hypothetical protein